MLNQTYTGCANCKFYFNGSCSYANQCGGALQWSDTEHCFVPIGYQIEPTVYHSKQEFILSECRFCGSLRCTGINDTLFASGCNKLQNAIFEVNDET